MCRKLGVPRSLIYYKKKTRKIDSELENAVIELFRKSRNNYGSRKIKIELAKRNIIASKQRIRLKSVLADYVYCFNNYRIHGSLCYLSPVQFKSSAK